MIVGEDQVLGQVQEAFEEAKRYSASGSILQRVFERAIRTGKTVRLRTQINKGAVSIGSIAVNLLKEYIGDLKNKKILIIGAGQIGALVGKALAARKMAAIFVANRTYERAVWLAKILNAQAVRFDRLTEFLSFADAAIVATAAPHYVLTHDLVSAVVEKRKGGKLLIIDLSQPRNVEESVANLSNVELRNIDNLRGIAQINLQMRLEEAKKAEAMLQDELRKLVNALNRERIEPIISALYSKAEKIRCREAEKALKMMKNVGGPEGPYMEKCIQCRKIVEDLSRELVEKTLLDPITNLRRAAVNNDFNRIIVAEELFNIKSVGRRQE
jgi:glutamyl-tRNA reductase